MDKKFITDPNMGLTSLEVKDRIKKGKVNKSIKETSKTIPEILKDNIFTFFNLINFTIAILLLYVGSYRNLLFMGVVIGNILIGIFQEIKAKNTIDKLSLLSRAQFNVIRDGFETNIPDTSLVEDEIILLSAGQQIPADAIVINGNVEVNESLLTGESRPIVKEKDDKLLSGSFIVSGKAKAQILKVGSESYAGELSKKAKKFKNPKSQIQSSLDVLIKTLAIIIIPVGILLFLKEYYVIHDSFRDSIVSVSAAIISLIPSGLIILTSAVLVVGVLKISRHKTLVQTMSSSETLARVDTLFLDKTGTITEGRIELKEIIPISNVPLDNIKKILTTFSKKLEDENSTINAVRVAAKDYNIEPIEAVNHIIPFSSSRKYSGFIASEGIYKFEYLLGAPSFILGEQLNKYKDLIDKYTNDGDRVLVLAKSYKPKEDYSLPKDLTPEAFLIFSDIIKKDAPDTLNYFEDQGVNLKIISGDDPKTASIIASRAGLDNADKYIDATVLKSDKDIEDNIEKYNVFGRVTPEQKKSFVKALRKKGHTIGMVGDGVNDVLALKEADVGVAMASGSDAARSIANLVLLDSNFASLPFIIKEGRQIINNLERSGSLYISKTIFSLFTVVLFMFLNISYPFAPIQLTLLNSITIGIPSVVLGLQPNSDLVKGDFFENIMRYALPAGITSFIGIICTVISAYVLGLDETIYSTIGIYLLTFTGMLLILKLSIPFNLLRLSLFIVLITLFVITIVFFSSFFYLTHLSFFILTLVAIICAGLFFVYLFLSQEKVANRLASRSAKLSFRLSQMLSKNKN